MAYKPRGLFNAKSIPVDKRWYYLTHDWVDMGFHTFFKGLSSKVNAMALSESGFIKGDQQNESNYNFISIEELFQ